jgi:hypothetical protein
MEGERLRIGAVDPRRATQQAVMVQQSTTAFDDPFATWQNDDLLVADESVAFVNANYPRYAPILVWPDLVTAFRGVNRASSSARSGSRRLGMVAAVLGFASLAMTGLVSELDKTALATRLLGALVAFLALASGIVGYGQVMHGRRKAIWLSKRFHAERLRQLYFQFIIRNAALAEQVVLDNSGALEQWNSRRARALEAFEHRMSRSLLVSLEEILADEPEELFWIDCALRDEEPAPSAISPELAELFVLLRRSRFEIQRNYAALKLRPSFHSPASRLQWVRVWSDGLTILTLIGSAVVGIMLLLGGYSYAVRWVGTAVGVATAAVVFGRVLNEGLQLASETDRYKWYAATVASLDRRFDLAASPAGKIGVLQEMERTSYQELRWFLSSFRDARFIF